MPSTKCMSHDMSGSLQNDSRGLETGIGPNTTGAGPEWERHMSYCLIDWDRKKNPEVRPGRGA